MFQKYFQPDAFQAKGVKQKYLPWLLVILTSLTLSFLYCPPYDIYFDDKEIFKYTGFLIKEGKVPYKDFFDHKPPMIFFINFVGSMLGSWGFWLLDALMVLWASLLFLKVNLKYKIIFPAVLPIVFNLILRNNSISFGVGMTREYTTVLELVVCCLVLLQVRFKYFFLGLLGTTVFLFQQEQSLLVVPFLVYTFWDDRKQQKKFLVNFVWLLAGSLTIAAPVVFYFAFHGALKDFWQSAFVFNMQWYTTEQKPGLGSELIVIKNLIYELKFEILLLMAVLAAMVSLFLGSERKALLIVSLLAVLLSFISEFLSGKIANGNIVLIYYFLPLAASVPYCLFVAFAFTKNAFYKNKHHQFIYSSLLLINLVLNIMVYVANYHKYSQDWIANSGAIKFLEQHMPQDYELYVFNHSNYTYAYNRFGILIPSKWLYHYFWEWYPDWDADGQVIQSIIADLKKHQTKFIIYDAALDRFQNVNNGRLWHQFIGTTYQQVDSLPVWMLKTKAQ